MKPGAYNPFTAEERVRYLVWTLEVCCGNFKTILNMWEFKYKQINKIKTINNFLGCNQTNARRSREIDLGYGFRRLRK